jgi:Major tropism determinant N-terminal domain
MAVIIQFRRDTAANWSSANPVLAEGELGLVTDDLSYKIGDGVTAWNALTARELTGVFDGATFNTLGTSDPSTPAAGTAAVYVGEVAGRQMLKIKGPSGLATSLQPMLARNKVGIWAPPGNAATLPGVTGFTAYTAVGTATARNVATGSLFTRMRRLGFVSAATAAALASIRVPVAQVTLGGVSGGGFLTVIRFGISDAAAVAGARMFMGMSSNTGAPTNVEPSTLTNAIGIGHGAADATFKLFYGGSAAQTPIDLGANFPCDTRSTDMYELALFAPPDSGNTVKYEVTRLNTGHVAAGTLTGAAGVALPANTTLLSHRWGYRTNNATALAVAFDVAGDYVETDY